MIGIALFKPDIPQNTAAIIRLCACFKLNVHIQDEINPHDNKHNLFITNVHRIYQSRKNVEEEFLNYLSGEVKNPSLENSPLLSAIEELDDLVILNDEAHHIGVSEKEWLKSHLQQLEDL